MLPLQPERRSRLPPALLLTESRCRAKSIPCRHTLTRPWQTDTPSAVVDWGQGERRVRGQSACSELQRLPEVLQLGFVPGFGKCSTTLASKAPSLAQKPEARNLGGKEEHQTALSRSQPGREVRYRPPHVRGKGSDVQGPGAHPTAKNPGQ